MHNVRMKSVYYIEPVQLYLHSVKFTLFCSEACYPHKSDFSPELDIDKKEEAYTTHSRYNQCIEWEIVGEWKRVVKFTVQKVAPIISSYKREFSRKQDSHDL